MAVRRTQAERREETTARLIEATIATLADRGYSQLTVATVCDLAALSQGALFRHFASRSALIAAATEEICRRHLELLASRLGALTDLGDVSSIAALVATLRQAARTAEHSAWHEVMVAARTDSDLHALVAPTLKRFEKSLLASIATLAPSPARADRLGVVLLSVMHLMDSEAVTVAVYPNKRLEAARVDWLVELLARELTEV